MPETYIFSTSLNLRAGDINYAGHMGNDILLSLVQEARIRFFRHHDLDDQNMDGTGMVISDSAAVYHAQAFMGQTLKFELAVGEFNKYGCDFFYRVTDEKTGSAVASVKTGVVFYDYENKKVMPAPEKFIRLFAG